MHFQNKHPMNLLSMVSKQEYIYDKTIISFAVLSVLVCTFTGVD